MLKTSLVPERGWKGQIHTTFWPVNDLQSSSNIQVAGALHLRQWSRPACVTSAHVNTRWRWRLRFLSTWSWCRWNYAPALLGLSVVLRLVRWTLLIQPTQNIWFTLTWKRAPWGSQCWFKAHIFNRSVAVAFSSFCSSGWNQALESLNTQAQQ